MTITSKMTLMAAAGFLLGAASSANAADLGGGCCADLEERVAELEATTARKGNRVVSLKVYGFVSRGILTFDAESDGNSTSDTVLIDEDDSRVGFTGSATLKPGWSAGYKIELETSGEQGDALELRQNNLWIESEQLGRVTLGQQSQSTDGIAHIVLANTYSDSGAFQNDLYNALTGGDYGDFDGGRGDLVRYDSPSVYGFILSAAWSDDLDGEDAAGEEYWDVTLRYSAEFNAFRIAGGVGYSEEDNSGGNTTEIFQGSASLMHTPSGLFAAFSAGESTEGGDDDSQYWYVTGGIEKAWLSYGKTTIYGEYGQYEDDAANAEDDTLYGFGLTQSFDAAALDIYAQYRYVEEDRPDGDSFATGLLGAKISF